MKKFLYVASFTFLGLVVSTLIHAVIEIPALNLIFGNPERFADTFWWQEWHLIHGVFAYSLWLAGFLGGVYYGFKFWEPYGSKPGFFCWLRK
jgi:hypothetical protein